MNNLDITILHVEDEPVVAHLVRAAFIRFGFRGTILTADTVTQGLALLDERSRKNQHVDLIVSDMHLPDGSGLDLVRQVRESPHWRLTPVVVLFGETQEQVINDAYALGANCYLPKVSESMIETVRSLHRCWVENALLPQRPPFDRSYAALSRAIELRTRTCEVYRRVAAMAGPEEGMKFWLERSLVEGNFSNLLALFRNKVTEQDIPAGMIDRLSEMQGAVENSLVAVEKNLEGAETVGLGEVYSWILDLADAVDEEVLVECLGWFFPRTPAASFAFLERGANQFEELGAYISVRAKEPAVQQRAESLRRRAAALREHVNRTAAHLPRQDAPPT